MEREREMFLKREEESYLPFSFKLWLESRWVRFRERVQQLFERREPKLPKISIKIFYETHNPEDWENFRDLLQKNGVHIYIPEFVCWIKRDLRMFRDISEGKITPETAIEKYDVVPGSATHEELKALYNSRIPIGIIDVPERSLLGKRLIRHELSFFSSFPYPPSPESSFEKTIKDFRKWIETFASLQREREEYMLSQLPRKIEELIKNHPELKSEKEIRVLMSLGGGHTSIWHRLSRKGEKVKAEFSYMPFVFPILEEAIRRYMFGKEVSDKLIAQALAERFFKKEYKDYFDSLTSNSSKRTLFIRMFISSLEEKDVKEIFERLKTEEAKSVWESILQRKGFKIPETEEEMDKIIAKRYPGLKFRELK